MFFCFFPKALKKPAITQKHDEAPDIGAAGAEPGLGAAGSPGGQVLLLDQPRLQQDRLEGREARIAPPGVKQPDKPVVFEEHNKAGIKADELGEQQRQIQGIAHTPSQTRPTLNQCDKPCDH